MKKIANFKEVEEEEVFLRNRMECLRFKLESLRYLHETDSEEYRSTSSTLYQDLETYKELRDLSNLVYEADRQKLLGKLDALDKKSFRLLKGISYLVPPCCREDFDFADADLRRDRKKMRKDGFGEWSIQFVMGWRTCWTVVGFLYPRIKCWLLKALALEVIMKKLGLW